MPPLLAVFARSGVYCSTDRLTSATDLLINVLLRLQPLLQAVQISLLTIRGRSPRQLDLLCGVVPPALRRVDSRHAGMYKPFVRMLLRILAEDRKGFIGALFSLQLPRIQVRLQRIGQLQRPLGRNLGI